ncbi:TIM-barrel domain-containing protein [Caldiplasma sukawensis]
MKIEAYENDSTYQFIINECRPVLDFGFKGKPLQNPGEILKKFGMDVKIINDTLELDLKINIKSRVTGFGEHAFSYDRKRMKLLSRNTDPGGYGRGKEPIYLPIPFFIVSENGHSQGIFINYGGEIQFDTGIENYNIIKAKMSTNSIEFFIIDNDKYSEVVRNFIKLTGKPVIPPIWAIGHSISRYTYYPEKTVLSIIDEYKKIVPVDTVYLDIHYMEGYRMFTWSSERFPNPEEFIDEIHKKGTKIVTIIDPSIKVDQNYEVFKEGLGSYMEMKNGDIFTGKMWPGLSAFPDFLNNKGRQFWKKQIEKFIKSGVDGIWLDMNEPTLLTEDHLFPEDAMHTLDNGDKIEHKHVRNYYPYFEAAATYEVLKNRDEKPFILTRSGFAGIQKFGAVWTGDNLSEYDDLKLQISMIISMSISGIVICGTDLGGFFGRSDPEMVAAYYRMALFFPLYRNHKTIDGNDQEVFLFPENVKKRITEAVNLRYRFLEHIYNTIIESTEKFEPVIRPVYYEWQNDDAFYAEDEYMLGEYILYAPQIEKTISKRNVYIPPGQWIDFNSNSIIEGPVHITSEEEFPIFIRMNSCIIFGDELRIYGNVKDEIEIMGIRYNLKSGKTGKYKVVKVL